jgi:hypothetical protein
LEVFGRHQQFGRIVAELLLPHLNAASRRSFIGMPRSEAVAFESAVHFRGDLRSWKPDLGFAIGDFVRPRWRFH